VEGTLVENALEQSVGEINHSRKNKTQWYKNWKLIAVIIGIMIALILSGISFYQAKHFNANISINGIKVSGLTADDALKKLQSTVLTNKVYIGKELIIDGNDTKMGFTEEDLPEVKKLLKSQWTLFPSFKGKDYTLTPNKQDEYRSASLKTQLEQELNRRNENLQAPKDAQVTLQEGKITIINGSDGTQYDIPSLVKEYENQLFTSEIHLNSILKQPFKEDSQLVKDQEKKLQELLQKTVDYKVQDKVYTLKGSEVILNASVSTDMKVSIDANIIKNKITEINNAQSTLGKNFNFTTHSGSVISVKGEGYGWALDVEKEAALVQAAFEKGEKSTSASNIH
jgi:Putative peptidoglycan binding domain